MTTAHRAYRPTESWMPAMAMLTIALLAVAALPNGVGAVGVMAPAHEGGGQLIAPPGLDPAVRLPLSGVERAIEALQLQESGRPDQFEAYEGLLQALADTLPSHPDSAVLDRIRALLASGLPAPAASDVMEVLPSFLACRRAEKALLGLTPGAPGSIEGAYLHVQLQKALRRSILGEEVSAKLYGTSHRMTEIHLVRQMLTQRDDLTEDEKQRLIREQMEALTVTPQPGDSR